MKNKLIAAFMVIIISLSATMSVFALTDEEEKKQLEDKKNQATNQLNDIKDEKKDTQTEIEKISSQVETLQSELDGLERQINTLNDSISEKQEEIDKKQKEIEEKEETLKNRLVALYEAGESSFLDVLFNSNGIMDFLSNYMIIQEITQCDTDLINQVEESKKSIEEDKKQLEGQKQEVSEVKEKQEAKSAQLKQAKIQKEAQVVKLSEEEKATQAEIDAYNAKIREVDNRIAEALRKAMEAEQNKNHNSGGSTGSAGANFDGTFAWPLDWKPWRVTSGMKWRWGRRHKGIDIGTDGVVGKRVVAAASGTVIYSTYQGGTSSNPGFGNYLIIYHGNGYMSLYAHMSSKAVGEGTRVSQGQLIGYSGDTGGVAPHLHFEIRKASTVSGYFAASPLDPLDYLPGGWVRTDI